MPNRMQRRAFGVPRRTQASKPSPDDVARNIVAMLQRAVSDAHNRLYANQHGIKPEAILAALGERALHVQSILASSEAMAFAR